MMNKMIYCAKFVKNITFGNKLKTSREALLSSGKEMHTEPNRGERLVVIFIIIIIIKINAFV